MNKAHHLRNEVQVELAVMHYYGLITTLSQSRYSSPLFAQRNNSARRRLLIDLRKLLGNNISAEGISPIDLSKFLGNNISAEGISPEMSKTLNFSIKSKCRKQQSK